MRLATLAVISLLSVSAFAQNNVGFKVGGYFPTDSTVKNALGDTWLSYGLSFGAVEQADGRRMGEDIEFVSRESSGNRLFMGTLSYGLLQPFGNGWARGQRASGTAPYFAVRGGLTYADYRIGAVDASPVLLNANAELGMTFGKNLNLSLRYDLMTETRGFNFSGATIGLKYTVVSF